LKSLFWWGEHPQSQRSTWATSEVPRRFGIEQYFVESDNINTAQPRPKINEAPPISRVPYPATVAKAAVIRCDLALAGD
jgi:hypothetical protein